MLHSYVAISFAQLKQDQWVLSWFPYPGFFLDVGMADGMRLSNTYMLEEKGWRGIGIDPFPTNPQCRPNTIIEECAVFSYPASLNFIRAGCLGGIEQSISPLHLNKIKDKPRTTVKAVTLASILDKHNAPNFIEYLSLDVEGAEYDILSTFPFDRYTFGCMTIEHNFGPTRQKIRQLLETHGYKHMKGVRFDDWYVGEKFVKKIPLI
jgi:FkbM family methyltransferase